MPKFSPQGIWSQTCSEDKELSVLSGVFGYTRASRDLSMVWG